MLNKLIYYKIDPLSRLKIMIRYIMPVFFIAAIFSIFFSIFDWQAGRLLANIALTLVTVSLCLLLINANGNKIAEERRRTLQDKLFSLFEEYGIPVKIEVSNKVWTIKQDGEVDHNKNMEMIFKEHGN